MNEWNDKLDMLTKNGFKKHISGNKSGCVSTVYALDTNKWETMFISPDDKYILLEYYSNATEARNGHLKWAQEVKNGFVPTEDQVVVEFGKNECYRFLEAFIRGKY